MRHRHLTHERYTLAAIDDVLERGSLADWARLLQLIREDPFGQLAERTLRIARSHHVPGTSELYAGLIQEWRERSEAGNQNGPVA